MNSSVITLMLFISFICQEACNLFHSLRKVDWSTAWLILTSLHSSEDLSTPNLCFKDIHINKDCFKRNEFTDNIKKVLYHDLSV